MLDRYTLWQWGALALGTLMIGAGVGFYHQSGLMIGVWVLGVMAQYGLFRRFHSDEEANHRRPLIGFPFGKRKTGDASAGSTPGGRAGTTAGQGVEIRARVVSQRARVLARPGRLDDMPLAVAPCGKIVTLDGRSANNTWVHICRDYCGWMRVSDLKLQGALVRLPVMR